MFVHSEQAKFKRLFSLFWSPLFTSGLQIHAQHSTSVPHCNEPWYSHILHFHRNKAAFRLLTDDRVLRRENAAEWQVSSLWICLGFVLAGFNPVTHQQKCALARCSSHPSPAAPVWLSLALAGRIHWLSPAFWWTFLWRVVLELHQLFSDHSGFFHFSIRTRMCLAIPVFFSPSCSCSTDVQT